MIIIRDIDWMRNDCPVLITVAGITYPSVEHAYQASKFTDRDLKALIATSPIKTAMKIGRSNEITTPSWEDNRLVIMRTLLRQKYSIELNIELAECLANTGKVEINGVGLNEFWGLIDESLDDKFNDFVGENNLGKILMEIRNEIQFSLGFTDTQELDYSKKLLNRLNNNKKEDLLIKNVVELFTILEKEKSGEYDNLNYYFPNISNCFKKIKLILDDSYIEETIPLDDDDDECELFDEYDDHSSFYSSFDSEYDSFDDEYDSFDDDDYKKNI